MMAVAGKPGRIKEDRHVLYGNYEPKFQRGIFAYRRNDTDQYVSAATMAAAGIVITQA